MRNHYISEVRAQTAGAREIRPGESFIPGAERIRLGAAEANTRLRRECGIESPALVRPDQALGQITSSIVSENVKKKKNTNEGAAETFQILNFMICRNVILTILLFHKVFQRSNHHKHFIR